MRRAERLSRRVEEGGGLKELHEHRALLAVDGRHPEWRAVWARVVPVVAPRLEVWWQAVLTAWDLE